jgi:16S rRNA processing protein RimM
VTDLVPVGRVGRPHGLDGSFVVEDASEDPERFVAGSHILLDGEEAKVVTSKRAGRRLVVRLDREARRGAVLAVPRSVLPETAEDEYYVFQLVGLEVVEEEGRRLGVVGQVHTYPANDVIELDDGRLLPLVESCVLDVNVAAGRIVVARGFADA